MSTTAKPLRNLLLALSLSALSTFGPNAAAENVFKGFTQAPTFTPPDGCIPRRETYGVMSACVNDMGRGRTFHVEIDTAVGFVFAGGNALVFVRSHVADIRAHWKEHYPHPRNNLAFSSKASYVVPANAPHGTICFEYSISVEREKTIDERRVPVVLRVEGLTCAWRVERVPAGTGNWNVELFWLEAFDEYAPSLGQKPMEDLDLIARDLFATARL